VSSVSVMIEEIETKWEKKENKWIRIQ
jgi:hypothetical protein